MLVSVKIFTGSLQTVILSRFYCYVISLDSFSCGFRVPWTGGACLASVIFGYHTFAFFLRFRLDLRVWRKSASFLCDSLCFWVCGVRSRPVSTCFPSCNTHVFRTDSRVLRWKSYLTASLSASARFIDSTDIYSVLYNTNCSFASVTMAWKMMKAIDWKLEPSLPLVCWLSVDIRNEGAGVFFQDGRIFVANQKSAELWNDFALPTIALLCFLSTCEFAQQRTSQILHDVYGGRHSNFFSSVGRLANVGVAASVAIVSIDTLSEFGSVALASSSIVLSLAVPSPVGSDVVVAIKHVSLEGTQPPRLLR